MKQFILERPPEMGPEGLQVRLEGDDYHYLVRVRRLRPGAVFPALLPGGAPVRIRVVSTAGAVLTGAILPGAGLPDTGLPDTGRSGAEGERRAEGIPRIILFQALPKGQKLDLIIRQATEAGVAEIFPFRGGFSVTGISVTGISVAGETEGAKQRRWQKIVREARQQSGSPVATRIHPPGSFEAALDYWERAKGQARNPVALAVHPPENSGPGSPDPLEKPFFHHYLDTGTDLTALAIGPEGGFTPAEIGRFLAAGWKAVSLGATVLRTETAALFAVAAAKTVLLESESWNLRERKAGNQD